MNSSDLVRKVATFGADIPTTPMFWKKEGNGLEWIVRQMSWNPPWCYSDATARQERESPRKRAKKEPAVKEEVDDDRVTAHAHVKSEIEGDAGALA